jgi:hypothetical protein
MFSRRLLARIKRHDYSFFGGITGWPEHIYDKDYSGHYERRESRMPLGSSQDVSEGKSAEDTSERSYAFRVTEEGRVEICDGMKE